VNPYGTLRMYGEHTEVDTADLTPPDWTDLALCAETDPEAFFPEIGQSARTAQQVCGACDVRAECLEYALKHAIRHGVWGGMSERERHKLLPPDVRSTFAAPDTGLKERLSRENAGVPRKSERQSSVRGVNWSKERQMWVARIKRDGRAIWLGKFATEEEAVRAVSEAGGYPDPATQSRKAAAA
jgi:WhiB family transcriptional regulator, redox-sensing transcriptional regulator